MRISTDLQTMLTEKRKRTAYNVMTDYYEKCRRHRHFYEGDQWYGVNAPDLDKPVLNFIRRACSFLTAMVTGDEIRATVTPYIHSDTNSCRADVINTELEKVIESSKLTSRAKNIVLSGVISGDGILYWLYRDGGVFCEQIKSTNVLYANPYLNDIQRQPYIMIESREYLEDVVEKAGKYGTDADKIRKDDTFTDDTEAVPMVTVVTKFYKKYGQVYYIQFTRDAIVKKETATGYRHYPFAKFSWDIRDNSCHGRGVVEYLIPNQIAVNKLWAMALLHERSMAFPKIFYDRTKIDSWTNKVGAAVGVIGNPNDAVAVSFRADDMSAQVMELVDKTIAYTKEFMGASDISLGNVAPDNTSAILAVQKSASIPLENQKQYFYQFVEDCVIVILDIMRRRYGKRFTEICDKNGVWKYVEFDFSLPEMNQLSYVIETDNSAPWSEGVQMKILENLYEKQILTDARDFVSAIPQSQLKNKQRILKKLENAQASENSQTDKTKSTA